MSSSIPDPPARRDTPTTTELSGGRWRPPALLVQVLGRSQARGAIGPASLTEHVAHAAGFVEAAGTATGTFVSPERFLDLGSGGGLPGLVVAAQLPQALGALLDGRTERGRLLQDHVDVLGWGNRLEVCAERAENAGHWPSWRGSFDLVVARGFGPPAVTAECAAPFLRPGGLLVVSEPPGEDGERWATTPLDLLGLSVLGGAVMAHGGTRYQVLRQARPCPDRWPRRTGVPAKRPLYREGGR